MNTIRSDIAVAVRGLKIQSEAARLLPGAQNVFHSPSTESNGGGALPGSEPHQSRVRFVGGLKADRAGIEVRHLGQDIRLARRLLLDQRLDEALEVLDRAERSLGASSADPAPRTAANIEALRAVAAMFRDDSARALHLARKAMERGDITHWASATARVVCQFAYWRLRDFAGFHGLLRQQAAVHRYRLPIVVGLCIDAAMELEQLRPSVAMRLAMRALEEAERVRGGDPVLSALPASLAAQLLYEQGALNEAEALIRRRLAAICSCGAFEAAGRAYCVLARIAAHRGQAVIAASLLQEAEDLGERRGWPVLAAMSLYERTRLSVPCGRIQEAQQSSERLGQLAARCSNESGSASRDVQHYCRMARVRLAIEVCPSSQTVDTLHRLHDEAVAGGNLYSAAQLALEEAGALERLGERQEGDRLFLRTLNLGSSAGLYQIFVDGRELIAPLLQRAFEQAREPGSSCRHLLPCIEDLLEQRRARRRRSVPAKAGARAIDGLSARESDVLMLVCRGLSNKRIAQSLAIAPETVKAHVKRIFMKLEVGSRAQAVFRASSLGLLPTADR